MKNHINDSSASRAEAGIKALFRNRRFFYALIYVFALLPVMAAAGCGDDSGAGTSPATAPQQQQPATTVADSGATATFDGADGPVTLRLAIARTEAERSRGLMFVDEMDTDLGMIFIWEAPVEGGFWMKNTYIPLSIAFIDADRRIIDIQDMDPESLEPRAPSSPYLFAIEANRGFFAANGIEVGSLVLLEGVSR